MVPSMPLSNRDDEAGRAFARWSGCPYEGQIVCKDCKRHGDASGGRDDNDGCDMAAGRIGRQQAFEAGWEASRRLSVAGQASVGGESKSGNDEEEDLRGRFRIVTNGLRFRVERLEWRGILWWRRQKWIPLCNQSWIDDFNPDSGMTMPVEFVSRGLAQARIDLDVAELRAELHGWTPDTIEEPKS